MNPASLLIRLKRLAIVGAFLSVFPIYFCLAQGVTGGGTVRSGPGDYRIQPLDVIDIIVVGEPLLTLTNLRISAGGTIPNYPFLGEISVQGKTSSQVGQVIKENLAKDYVRNPQVVVNIRDYRRREVSVFGQVNQPGAVELPPEEEMDIVEAVARAGGLTKLANKGKIEVRRNGNRYRFSLDDLMEQTDPEKKFWLKPGDVIHVHDRWF